MKKLLTLSLLLLFSFNGWTQVSDEIHQRCKDVADYVGCVQIFSGTIAAKNNNKLDLENSLRLLPRRLENTVLRDFSNAIEPFIDALSIAEGDKTLADSELLSDSTKIEKALYIARKAWNDSIEINVAIEANLRSINRGLESFGLSGSLSSMGSRAIDLSDLKVLNKLNSCFYKNNKVHSFNEALGGRAMDYPCDINKAQDCDSRYNKDVHSQMLIVIADAAIDVSNSEELDYPSIESIKLNTDVDECENKYATKLNKALADPDKALRELIGEGKPKEKEVSGISNNTGKVIKAGELNILLDGMELSDIDGQGVIILSIEPKSKTDRARLKSGDIISGVGNTTIDNLDDFISIIKDKDILILRVNRNGRKFIFQVR